jgi:hypothetical protein
MQGKETSDSEGPLEPTSHPQSVLVIGASLKDSGGFETIDIWVTAFAPAVAMAEKKGHPSLNTFCANLTQVTEEIVEKN